MTQPYKFNVTNLNLYYGDFHALKNVNMQLEDKVVTSFIGPSGCGKSTFLKTLTLSLSPSMTISLTGHVRTVLRTAKS